MRRAVVIGAGLGGLAVAIRLAAGGWKVTICERGPRPGGKMNLLDRSGFRFDTGPSLITLPWVFKDLFSAAGSRLEDHIELVRLRPLARYIFADGTALTYTSSLPDWLGTIREIEPADVQGFLRFMKLGAALFEVSRRAFLSRSPYQPPDRKVASALRYLPLRHGWGNYSRTVASFFKSPHLRQLYLRYPTYVGSSPYRSPATLAVIPYIEYAYGGWHVRGGLYRLVEALTDLALGLGVELMTRVEVERIETSGHHVRGVALSGGRTIETRLVVMNGDASRSAFLLDRLNARELPIEERSLSGLVFLIGLGGETPQLAHHQVYFSRDYGTEFRDLLDRHVFPADPTVYVSAPARTDRTVVRDEGELLFIMANAPAVTGTWNEDQLARARSRVMDRLRAGGFPSIDDRIVVEEAWTPDRFAGSYLAPGGAIYGTHSHGWRRAFLRPANKDRRTRGLYYVGGSSHPGGGTPTVLLSAEITSELIRRHEGT